MTGETAFTRKNDTNVCMFDAMPAFWKHLSIQHRQEIVNKINSMDTTKEWSKENISHFMKYVKLKDVPFLQSCYKVAKEDETVILGVRSNSHGMRNDIGALTSSDDVNELRKNTMLQKQQSLTSFMLKPADLVEKATQPDADIQTKTQLFNHMVRYRNRENASLKKKNIVSSWINVEVSNVQQDLFNPGTLDTVIGFIMKDSKGEGAKKKLPQRRLNIIDSGINSHCRVLNNSERIELIKKSNHVADVMGELENER